MKITYCHQVRFDFILILQLLLLLFSLTATLLVFIYWLCLNNEPTLYLIKDASKCASD